MAKKKSKKTGKGKKTKGQQAPEDFYGIELGEPSELKTDPVKDSHFFVQDVTITARTDKDPAIRQFEWARTMVSLSHAKDSFVFLYKTKPIEVAPFAPEDSTRQNSQVTFTFLRVKRSSRRRVLASGTDDDIVVTIQTNKKKP